LYILYNLYTKGSIINIKNKKDGNGLITREELQQIMGGTSIPEDSWKSIINDIDKNGDGEVPLINQY